MAFGKRSKQHQHSTTVEVIVPPNLGPERRIIVQTPDGEKINAVVPEGCAANSTFRIQVPTQKSKRNQQQRSKQPPPPPPSPTHRIQTIRVPDGKRKKGEKFQVRFADGRTMVVTVPFNGCQEFSLDTGTQSKRQRQQNWHDNPLAIAPMVLGPLMM